MSDTRQKILDAARSCLLEVGYANFSTRRVADAAGVRVGHIHYHFGSKSNLVLSMLGEENERLLHRQAQMYGAEEPLWKRWEQACDFLDDDLRTGYVRVLHEMTTAGFSDPDVATAVKNFLQGWMALLTDVATQADETLGGLGPFTAQELAALIGDAFLGAEAMLLLGVTENEMPHRSALRRVGLWIREVEEG